MSKKLLISVFLCFFIFLSMLFSQEESEEKRIWEDEQIRISFDKIERLDSLPPEFQIEGYPAEPEKGYDFVIIHITTTNIKDIIMSLPEIYDLLPSRRYSARELSRYLHLYDTRGYVWMAEIARFKATIPTENGQDSSYTAIFSSDGYQMQWDKGVPSFDIRQKATWNLVFVMSKEAKPNELNFVYSYKGEPPKPKKKKWGKIAINLSEKMKEDTEFVIKVKVTKTFIRLRPDAESEVVAKVSLGTVFTPEKKIGEWYQVSFRDERGFVLSGYIHERSVMLLWE